MLFSIQNSQLIFISLVSPFSTRLSLGVLSRFFQFFGHKYQNEQFQYYMHLAYYHQDRRRRIWYPWYVLPILRLRFYRVFISQFMLCCVSVC